MRRAVPQRAALLIGCVFFSINSAQAAPGDATRLEYARSEGAAICPDRVALKAAVSKRLGYDPFFPAARQAIVVEIVDAEGELRARMRLIDEQGMIIGSRELREKAEQCAELVASLALAISIALDPNAALGEARATSAAPERAESDNGELTAPAEPPAETMVESAAQEHPQKTTPPGSPSVHTSAVDRERIQLAARGAFFGDWGSAPALGFGWRLGLDLHHGGFRLAAEFSQQLPASKTIAEGGKATTSLLTGTLAPCFSRPSFAGCGLLGLGALRTRGENIPNPSSQSSFYAALGARFEYTPTLFRTLQLLTQLDVLKPLTPVSLHARGEEVWRTPFLTFAAGVGLRWRFY